MKKTNTKKSNASAKKIAEKIPVAKKKKVRTFCELINFGLTGENVVKEVKDLPTMANPLNRDWGDDDFLNQNPKRRIFTSFTSARCFGIYKSRQQEKLPENKDKKKLWASLATLYFKMDKPKMIKLSQD